MLLAMLTGRKDLYVRWAYASVTVYHGLDYWRELTGAIAERLGLRADGG